MKATRRQFIKLSAIAGAGLAAYKLGLRMAYAFYASPPLRKWLTNLRGVGPAGIPVAAPDVGPAPVTGVTHYTIDINQFEDTLHPALDPTTLWGFNPAVPLGGGVQPQKHLGGIVVVRKNTPLQFTFRNNLPETSIIPVDVTIPGANQAQNRVAVHIHGGLVPWISDGGPFDWWAPNGDHGLSFLNNQVLNPSALNNEGEYYYPNNQSARLLWYHDHAFGITRTNAYAGIASGYIIRDAFEDNLQSMGLPPYIEASVLGGTTVRELPIVIQDKIFVGSDILTADPSWPGPQTAGSLWYAHIYEDPVDPGFLPLPHPSCVPEFFGDTMLVNGTVYPKAIVEARRYRLRILNACNARFLNLQLYETVGNTNTINLAAPYNAKTSGFASNSCLQIGTEGGFLPILSTFD